MKSLLERMIWLGYIGVIKALFPVGGVGIQEVLRKIPMNVLLSMKSWLVTGMSSWYLGSMDCFTPIKVGWIRPVNR